MPFPGTCTVTGKEPVNSMLIAEKDKLAVIWGEEYPVLLKFLVSNDLVHMAEFFIYLQFFRVEYFSDTLERNLQ